MHSFRISGRTALIVAFVLLSAGCSTVTTQQLAEEYFNLGNAYFELGRYEQSFDYYSRALELSDSIPAAGFNLARLHEQRQEWDAALSVIEDLRQADPSNGLYLETEAFLRYRNGEVASARDLYADLIREYPERRRLRYNLGLLEMGADEPERAWQALAGGLESARDAEDTAYLWLVAEAAWQTGRRDVALRQLEVFRELVTDNPGEQGALAGRLADWGYPLAALEILQQIPGEVDADPDLLFLTGRLYLEATDDFERGLEALVAAISAGFPSDDEEFGRLIEELPEDERELIEQRIEELNPTR